MLENSPFITAVADPDTDLSSRVDMPLQAIWA
jgi:hypothetical protein